MFSSNCLIFIVFVSAVPRVALPQAQPAYDGGDESLLSSEPTVDKSDNVSINERLFIKLFVKSRKEHLKAVKKIREMDSYEKQYKMVKILAENSLNVIESGRAIIEGGKFNVEESEALKNTTIRQALSTILENSALFGDVVLQLPEITRRVIKSQKNWNNTIQWALKFADETRNLLDESTIIMFDLVRQELKITARDPAYTNPYWTRNNKDTAISKGGNKPKKYSKKSEKQKGPRLVNIEL